MGEDMDLHNVYKGMEREFKNIITSITLRQVPTNQANGIKSWISSIEHIMISNERFKIQ